MSQEQKRSIKRPGAWLVASLLPAELAFTGAEGFLVVYPLLNFYPACREHPELLGVMGVALALWCACLLPGLRRLVREETDRASLYRLGRSIPRKALLLRLALWGAIGLGGAHYLVEQGAIAGRDLFTVLTVCLVHSLAAALMRWALQKVVLRVYLERRGLDPGWLAFWADTLFERLIELSYVLGVVTAALLAVFVFLFVPISLEQFLRMETYFPWAAVVIGAVWYFGVASKPFEPLIAYLRRESEGEDPDQELFGRACRAAHRLPFILALIKMGFFVIGGVALFVQAITLYEFSLMQALMVLGAIVVVTLGTAIYEMIWSRSVLRQVVAHLMTRPEAEQVEIRAPSLRFKMLLSFGGVVVFTVMLALFWTYLQYGNLRADFAATQAEREIADVLEKVGRQPGEALPRRLERVRPLPGSRHIYVPSSGAPSSPLPLTAVDTIRRRDQGVVELADHGWAGAYRRVDRARPELGSLLVLLPLSSSGRVSLNLQVLIFFFINVLGVSLGVVLLTSADLTHPLASLEQRAAEMARGKLDQPVLPGGESDELGRLTAAFEKMRLALKDKIQTIEALNVGLEEKVQLRTAELERSNTELTDAIRALKEAQQRLVLSEKLASVGQLVAGIAHEVNNPLNAVINTVEPLAETVGELSAGEISDSDQLAEAKQDLRSMLKVIRSGAQRTQRIVQALRNYSRQDDEELCPVDLTGEIEETLALLAHELRGITVERHLEVEAPVHVLRGRLNQALMNLIANAAAALEGQEDPKIVIRSRTRARNGDKEVVITIEDNGPGIPDDVQPRIFDPFFTTKDVGKGTGLGLSITAQIIEQHGGQITVDSSGEGTTFTLAIPQSAAVTSP